jgi:hypothetical protein
MRIQWFRLGLAIMVWITAILARYAYSVPESFSLFGFAMLITALAFDFNKEV